MIVDDIKFASKFIGNKKNRRTLMHWARQYVREVPALDPPAEGQAATVLLHYLNRQLVFRDPSHPRDVRAAVLTPEDDGIWGSRIVPDHGL